MIIFQYIKMHVYVYEILKEQIKNKNLATCKNELRNIYLKVTVESLQRAASVFVMSNAA